MSNPHSPEQTLVLNQEISNTLTVINAVLAQGTEAYRAALNGGTIQPAMDAFYQMGIKAMQAALIALRTADEELSQDLNPDEVRSRQEELVDNCQYRGETFVFAQQAVEELIAAGRYPEAEKVVVDFQAKLLDLVSAAKDLVAMPGSAVIEAVSNDLRELADRDNGPISLPDFDDDIVARLVTVAARFADSEPETQFSQVQGSVMEELTAIDVRTLVDQLNAFNTGPAYRFFPAGNLTDRVNGKFGDLGDGFIGRVVGDRLEVVTVLEAKAGSAKDLYHRDGKKTDIDLEEATRYLYGDVPDVGRETPEKLYKMNEFSGQLDSTRARLENGEVFLHGTRYQISDMTNPDRVLVTGYLPADVAPKSTEVLRVDLTAAEIKTVAATLIAAYTAAQAAECTRLQDENQRKDGHDH